MTLSNNRNTSEASSLIPVAREPQDRRPKSTCLFLIGRRRRPIRTNFNVVLQRTSERDPLAPAYPPLHIRPIYLNWPKLPPKKVVVVLLITFLFVDGFANTFFSKKDIGVGHPGKKTKIYFHEFFGSKIDGFYPLVQKNQNRQFWSHRPG